MGRDFTDEEIADAEACGYDLIPETLPASSLLIPGVGPRPGELYITTSGAAYTGGMAALALARFLREHLSAETLRNMLFWLDWIEKNHPDQVRATAERAKPVERRRRWPWASERV